MQIAFQGEIILTQYCTENKILDAYLPKYRVAVEIDEYDHEDRDSSYEQSWQLMIENHEITVIRTNPDDLNFSTCRLINQIYMHISKLTNWRKKQKIKEQGDKIQNEKDEKKESNKKIKEQKDENK